MKSKSETGSNFLAKIGKNWRRFNLKPSVIRFAILRLSGFCTMFMEWKPGANPTSWRLDVKSKPEDNLPGVSGQLYLKRDAEGLSPHVITSIKEQGCCFQPGKPIFPGCTGWLGTVCFCSLRKRCDKIISASNIWYCYHFLEFNWRQLLSVTGSHFGRKL